MICSKWMVNRSENIKPLINNKRRFDNFEKIEIIFKNETGELRCIIIFKKRKKMKLKVPSIFIVIIF